MGDTPVSLDKWRDYFSGANSDIFDIIEHAIMIAASDCPYDFKLKRDRIAETLFTCKVAKCLGCNRIELSIPCGDCSGKIDDDDDKCKSGVEAGGSKDTKESKVNSSRDEDDDDDHREVMEMNVNQVSNHSYEDAEALTDEIEEESQYIEEVLRIKEIVDNSEEKSDELLFESLRRLQLMRLSVEILKTSEIGKSVNSLRKRKSKEIRNLARTLIEDWKVMVDEWVSATTAIAESAKTSADEEEEGLPSPPLDEGAFFAIPSSMELTQFFDGMDDDGNLRNSGEFNKNQENGRMRRPERRDIPIQKFASPNAAPNDRRIKINQESTLKKETPPCKPNGPGRPKPLSGESVTGRPKPQNINNVIKDQRNIMVQKKPTPHQREKLNCDNTASVPMKLEAAKRKLHERYQEAENAKKQRTIQVVELHDLPKQSLVQRNPQMKNGNHNRRWGQGQR
ncbi:hypothetical protein ACS0TY_031834 [Phlomoides rotata]